MRRLPFLLAAALAGSAMLPPAASAAATRTVVRDITSATGHHVWYQWQVGGLDLYNGVQVVNTLPNGRTQSTNAAPVDLTLAGAFVVDAQAAQLAAKAAVNAAAGSQTEVSKVAFAEGGTARRAWL